MSFRPHPLMEGVLMMDVLCPPVHVEQHAGTMVVTCNADSFLWPSVDEVGSILLGLAEELDGRQLVLDFGDVDYLSGAALEKLVVLQRKAASEGSTLIIDNVSSYLLEIFSVTGLAGIMEVNPTCPAGAGI